MMRIGDKVNVIGEREECTVVWVDGRSCGLKFVSSPETTISDLDRLVTDCVNHTERLREELKRLHTQVNG